ncbi:MAG TPA: hypothetical protein VF727_12160 [Allosphingosinicella sp.]|jgi:hypothetical protein
MGQPEYHATFDEVRKAEIAFLKKRARAKAERRQRGQEHDAVDEDALIGLALSGGGIRSASFCMGVVQQLHVAGIVDRLHYMSTVSGGGYTGSSLSWFMAQPPDREGRLYGTEADNFPFCGGDPAAIRNATPEDIRRTAAPVDGRTVLDYIRQRSSYLNPGAGFSVVSAMAIVLRSVLTSVLGFVLLMAALTLVIFHAGGFRLQLDETPLKLPAWIGALNALDIFAAGGVALLLVLLAAIALYSVATAIPFSEKIAYEVRRHYQQFAGYVLAVALGLFALSLLHLLIDGLTAEEEVGELPLLGSLSTALGGIAGLAVHGMRDARPTVAARAAAAVLPGFALFLLVAGLGILGHLLAHWACSPVHRLDFPRGLWWRPLDGIEKAFLVGTAVYVLWTNINLTGLHRFYRDRLMETFMPDPDDILGDGQAATTTADDKALSDICGEEADGPYHLINAHVVLLGAGKARHRSRGGDSFVLSRLFCGSEATGFIATQDWLPGPKMLAISRRVGKMSLPTAMAISGAALNPRGGADGQGATRGGVVSALLNLLNLRLGYWVPSPRKLVHGRLRKSYRASPNFIFPGLIQGMFGFSHNERANWLELSDGGHFENTGIYELVRRGVRTIIFADGSTDPDIALQSFANALEKIYIDFNVQVDFPEQGLHFTGLMKGSGEPLDLIAQRLQFAKAGFAVGTIRYPKVNGVDAPPGTLVYIKSTMVRDLPAALYSYKAVNPLFPSESLADQFFSEQQFEAYRALGFALTRSMAESARGSDWGGKLGL